MAVGSYRHKVLLQEPGPAVPDGDGGFTQTWTNLTPAIWDCSIEPATARDLERVTSGTVLSTATHVLKGRHHPGITTQTRITFKTRVFEVSGVSNPEERDIETVVIAEELVA